MKSFKKYSLKLLLVILVLNTSKAFPEADESVVESQRKHDHKNDQDKLHLSEEDDTKDNFNAPRGLASSYEVEEHNVEDGQDHQNVFRKKAKPLKNIFMGIYKNYKSTYLGNKTSSDYKKRLRERISGAATLAAVAAEIEAREEALKLKNESNKKDEEEKLSDDAEELRETSNESKGVPEKQYDSNEVSTEDLEEQYDDSEEYQPTTLAPLKKQQKIKKLKKSHKAPKSSIKKDLSPTLSRDVEEPFDIPTPDNIHHYDIGSSMNVSRDMQNDMVTVKLDGNNLRDMVSGRWLDDNSEEGRGKKYEMVTKVLPLFILPFLIQSAIVPFLVTKLKLLLVKSILIGKLAIFLLIISAIKNSNKPLQTYEVAPSYWAGEPSRRSELAASASNMAYNGYRVEGKPSAWVN